MVKIKLWQEKVSHQPVKLVFSVICGRILGIQEPFGSNSPE